MTRTDADAKRAVDLLRGASADGLIQPTEPRKQPEMVERIAAALADERERTLASCYGRHEELMTVLTGGPGVVTCNGHELRWTARP